MKKFLVFILLVLSLFNLGCNSKLNSVTNNISELQLTYYIYEDDDYTISLISGSREKDYILDGISTESKNYCVLMLEQTNFQELNNINIRINGKDNLITPLLNPYNNNYVYDLEIPLSSDNLISVSFDDKFFSLENLAVNFAYSYKTCIDSIINDDKLLEFFNGNKFNGEVFIRLIKLKDFDNIFYQILFVSTDFSSVQYVINPNTLENINI